MYFAPTSAECKKILIVIKNIKCTTCLHFLRRGNLFCMSCSAPVWTHELVCSLLLTSMLTPPPPPAGGSRVICQMRSLRAVGNPVWTRILSAVTVRQADRLHDYLWLVIQTVSLKLNILLHFFFLYFFFFFFEQKVGGTLEGNITIFFPIHFENVLFIATQIFLQTLAGLNKSLLCLTSKKQQNRVANSLASRPHSVPCCVRPAAAAAGPPRTHWFALPSCPDSAAPLEGGEDTLNGGFLLRCHVSQRVQRLRDRLTPSLHGCMQSPECLEIFFLTSQQVFLLPPDSSTRRCVSFSWLSIVFCRV